MTQVRFEKIWSQLECKRKVTFAEHGEEYTLRVIGWPLDNYILERRCWSCQETVLIHWSKYEFERLLAF